jgi:hypothetical protein
MECWMASDPASVQSERIAWVIPSSSSPALAGGSRRKLVSSAEQLEKTSPAGSGRGQGGLRDQHVYLRVAILPAHQVSVQVLETGGATGSTWARARPWPSTATAS